MNGFARSLLLLVIAASACTKLKADTVAEEDGGVSAGEAGSEAPRARAGMDAAGSDAAIDAENAGSGGRGGSAGGADAPDTIGDPNSAGAAAGASGGGAGSAGDGGESGAAGSGGSAGSAPSCAAGSEGCACKNGGCDPDLACLDGLCTSEFCGNGATEEGEECDDANDDDSDGCVQGCKRARCGDGHVQAGVEECDDANPADGDDCSNACKKHYNVAFVTSTTYSVPNLGGVAGADAACKARAAAGGLSGRFVAWIGDSKASIMTRLQGARGWVRPDGKPFLDEAGGAATYFPPNVTELKTTITSDSPAALGGYADGTGDCVDWTSTATGEYFGRGDPTGGAGAWNGSFGGAGCGSVFRLYCFQNEFSNQLTITKAAGRIAFASNEPWAPAGGIAAADARCAADAQAAGLAGTFKAMLATTSASAASRFSTAGGPWVRPDGIPIVAQAADLFAAGGLLLAPLQVTADGRYLTNYGGWSGNADPQAAGTSTCTNWTSSSAGVHAVAGRVPFSRVPAMLAFDPDLGCDNAYTHLYCLQTP